MAYTINANAKNVWIRDNEDTRDLSIQTDASSVYLDNGRTLEQELGEGSMVSNVATVDTSMSKVIDGTLDGAYESLVFKGKSLVNVAQPFDRSITDVWATIHLRHSLLKQSTKYYYQVFDLPSGFQHVFTNSDGSTFLGTYTTNNISTFTTNLELTSDRIVLHINDGGKNALTQEQLGKIKVMVIEYQQGMENWDIPYFTGLCDVKMPILRNVGKNLFDVNLLKGLSSRVVVTDGVVTMNNAYSNGLGENGRKVFGFLKPNKTYRYSCTVTNTGQSNGLDGGFYFGKRLADGTSTYFSIYPNSTVTIPSDWDDYTNAIMYGALNNNGLVTVRNMQFEESNVATYYEDYKTNILRTSEEIVLREVNGVQDTYNPLTGEYIKRTGEIVLNGSQQVMRDGSLLYFALKDVPENNFSISDRLPSITVGQIIDGVTGVGVQDRGTGGRLYINIGDLSTEEEITQYLQNTPVTVQYKLAKPVTSIVKPSTMTPFAYQNGHVIVESGFEGQSLLPTLEYSTVVNRTGQVESVAKTIQTQEKQLTMLEQMLIQNIIGLDYSNTVLALNLEINEVM